MMGVACCCFYSHFVLLALYASSSALAVVLPAEQSFCLLVHSYVCVFMRSFAEGSGEPRQKSTRLEDERWPVLPSRVLLLPRVLLLARHRLHLVSCSLVSRAIRCVVSRTKGVPLHGRRSFIVVFSMKALQSRYSFTRVRRATYVRVLRRYVTSR
jgi:hypothetical protein